MLGSLDLIRQLEEAMDSRQLQELPRFVWPEVFPLLEAFSESRWADVYAQVAELFAREHDSVRKAFILQWAVAASDLEYDMRRRRMLVSRWREIPDWGAIPYCRYLKAYHEAVGRFFSGSLRDAESWFKSALDEASRFSYPRGQLRATFHLGLIARDRGDKGQAIRLLFESRALAVSRNNLSFLKRIDGQLIALGQKPQEHQPDDDFAAAEAQLEKLLLAGKCEQARTLLMELEIRRRKLGYRRDRERLGLYLGLFLVATGRNETGEGVLKRISDPVLRLKALQLKKRLIGPLSGEAEEIKFLQEALGASQVVLGSEAMLPNEVEIAGIRVDTIKDVDVRNLLMLMLERKRPVTKAEITERIFGLDYDPTRHDPRIYRLVHKARLAFGTLGVILNRYGTYEVNPELFGRGSRSTQVVA